MILLVIAIAGLAGLLVGALAARRRGRQRDEELARRAAREAIERGLVRVRGEQWLRAHKR